MANIRKISRTIDVCIHEDVISQYQLGCRSDKVQIENYLVEQLTDSMKNAKKEIEFELLAALRGDVYHEPADVAPVVHAHWIFYANGTCDCSNCHTVWESNMVNRWIEYCPFCGAKMDEEVE